MRHQQMFRKISVIRLTMAMLAGLLLGCGGGRVDRITNVERAALTWSEAPQGKGGVCLEYSTAAHELRSTRAGLDLSLLAGKSGSLSFESTASLAQIYTVSDIMQFGHAALYRLCEAANNGHLTKAEYVRLVEAMLTHINDLIKLQTTSTQERTVGRLVEKKSQIDAMAAKIQALKAKKDPTSADLARIPILEDQLQAAQRELDDLVHVNNLEGLVVDGAPSKSTDGSSAGPPKPEPAPEKPAKPKPPTPPNR